MSMMQSTDISIPASDGVPLAATLYTAATNRDWLVLNSATGVKRGFYRHYAAFMCAQGFNVLTYDYRGIGGSRSDTSGPILLQHWGERDFDGVLSWLAARYPDAKRACVAHSVGGQIIGLAPNHHRLDAVLGVAVQSGYWGHWSGWHKLRVWASWHVIMPPLARLCGHLPAWVLGGEPLPKDMVLQWARWGRQPHYVSDLANRPWRPFFGQVRLPMRFYAIADDVDFAPAAAVRALAAFYPQAAVEVQTLRAVDFGAAHIGHFGFFKSAAPPALWQKSCADVREMLNLGAEPYTVQAA